MLHLSQYLCLSNSCVFIDGTSLILNIYGQMVPNPIEIHPVFNTTPKNIKYRGNKRMNYLNKADAYDNSIGVRVCP